MRKVWWLVIGGAILLAVLLAVLGFILFQSEPEEGTASQECTPEKASPAAGNANVDGKALGKGFARQIVIRVTDKKSGAPVRGARVSVQGTMDCPHFMPLYQKKLRETATGTYTGDYQLIMRGHWIFHIVVRSEQSGSTTASFPVTLEIRG